MIAIPVVRHGQREPLLPAEPDAPAVPDPLPEDEPLAPPALEPDEPAPVSVLTLPGMVVEGDVVDAVVEVASVVDGVVAVVVLGVLGVLVVVTAEPGVALDPELLLAVSTPRLQPARPAVARASTAM